MLGAFCRPVIMKTSQSSSTHLRTLYLCRRFLEGSLHWKTSQYLGKCLTESWKLEAREFREVDLVHLGTSWYILVQCYSMHSRNQVGHLEKLVARWLRCQFIYRPSIDQALTKQFASAHVDYCGKTWENHGKPKLSFQDSGSIYLALEYCDGGDFGDKASWSTWPSVIFFRWEHRPNRSSLRSKSWVQHSSDGNCHGVGMLTLSKNAQMIIDLENIELQWTT